MLNYQVKPGNGDFMIGYPTPGAEHVFTVASTASDEGAAEAERARLNEAQVTGLRESMSREANLIVREEEK